MDRIAVILWLYHKDLWPEFYSLLAPLSNRIHLYLGLENGSDPHGIVGLESFDRITISYHDNYGADVAPFLKQLQLVQEPLFIKLHSKKSIIGPRKQVHWRGVLLHDLIGSEDIFLDNINQFQNNNGLLGSKSLLWDNRECKNVSKIQELCKILDLNYDILQNGYFIAGNMFMSQTEIYKSVFNAERTDIIDNLLQQERGKISDIRSAKYAHSLERIFGYIITGKKLNFLNSNRAVISIKNDLSPRGYFSLVEMYNGYCYIEEDLCVFGKIILADDSSYWIEWHHLPSIHQQRYTIVHKTPKIIEKSG